MSIKYITENDKNGKARYYKVIDGKKKVTSRAEYEAHKDEIKDVILAAESNLTEVKIVENPQEQDFQLTLDEIQVKKESEKADGEVLLAVAKFIIGSMCGKNVDKVKLQKTKTGKKLIVNYRNYMVFSVELSDGGAIKSVKFMGTTEETRKNSRIYKLDKQERIREYKEEIANQVEYIDQWYLNASVKAKRAS